MTMDELLLQAVEQRLLRPLDVQFALMVAQEAHPAVKLTAAILSRDAGEGHVCLPISRLAEDELLSAKAAGLSEQILELTGAPDGWLPLLNDAEAVSGGERPTPMILCGERLYLNRMWRNELTVARFFNEANQVLEVDEARLASTLDALFPPAEETDWQKVAAAVALTRRISVISGGPGTGKTTTVAKLLAALIQTFSSAASLSATNKRRWCPPKPAPSIACWARSPAASGCAITPATRCILTCWWWMKPL